jgi:hypothetical protein
MAETGPRGNWEGDEDKSLAGRDLRGVARILEDGDDRLRVEGEREVEAAAAAAVAVDMAVRAVRMGEGRVAASGLRGRRDREICSLYSRPDRNGRPDRAGLPLFCRFRCGHEAPVIWTCSSCRIDVQFLLFKQLGHLRFGFLLILPFFPFIRLHNDLEYE